MRQHCCNSINKSVFQLPTGTATPRGEEQPVPSEEPEQRSCRTHLIASVTAKPLPLPGYQAFHSGLLPSAVDKTRWKHVHHWFCWTPWHRQTDVLGGGASMGWHEGQGNETFVRRPSIIYLLQFLTLKC